jgi:outer membrane receptor protein involved in Fe transport
MAAARPPFVFPSDAARGEQEPGRKAMYSGRERLLASTLLAGGAALLLAGEAAAQTPANPAQADQSQLEEVVVTATRQADTVNRVPLSITAQTQRNLDQQGIRNVADLQGAAPALVVTAQTNPSVANIAVRGISDLGQGAPTTGFYLDDTPIQKRNVGGAFSGNGTPLPPLFDLDRVEVLRGPQGTLFGGSSEGGTVRYITPTPSLTRFSEYVRGEVSKQKYADDPSYELGVAVGGPIVADKLGFRISVFDRKSAGYVDHVDRITGRVRYEDANESDTRVLRAAVTWAPTDRLRATFAYFSSRDQYDSIASTYTPPITNALVAQPVCFNTRGITPQTKVTNPPIIPCSVNGAPNPLVTYQRPGFTYGPYPDVGPGKTLASQALLPSKTNLVIPSLTIDYDFGKMSMKAITSYIADVNKQRSVDGPLSQVRDSNTLINFGDLVIRRQFTSLGQLPEANYRNGLVDTRNQRIGLTQEVRFSSAGDARPLSWVAGVFYSNFRGTQYFDNNYADLDLIAQTLYGMTAAQRYGVGPYLVNGLPVGFDAKRQKLKDVEIAGFGEFNYWVTDKLRLTAGLRVSRVSFEFEEVHFGPASGFNIATLANGGGPNVGRVAESPVTPKFTAQYQFTDNDMAYVTAAKGFRAGGVNGNLPEAICAPGFAQYGLTTASLPITYKSDTVWSYEGGGKVRVLNNRVQLNGSVYRIDWKNPQLTINVGLACPAFLGNAGAARSEGFELEAQALLFRGFTGNLAIGYTNARYTQNALALTGANPPLIAAFKGQKIAVSPLTVQVGGRYDVQLAPDVRAYVRADYRYIQHYKDTLAQVYSFGGFANASYAPDNLYPNTDRTNLRVGVEYGPFDINVFANNLFNSTKGNFAGGRGGCAAPSTGGTAACTTFATYNPYGAVTPATAPRQIGIQIAYRH